MRGFHKRSIGNYGVVWIVRCGNQTVKSKEFALSVTLSITALLVNCKKKNSWKISFLVTDLYLELATSKF